MDDTEQRLTEIETRLSEYNAGRLGVYPLLGDVVWLVSQLREARKDTARMDWLEVNCATMHCNFAPDDEAWSCTVDNDGDGGWVKTGASPRAAIDAAMRASTPDATEATDSADASSHLPASPAAVSLPSPGL